MVDVAVAVAVAAAARTATAQVAEERTLSLLGIVVPRTCTREDRAVRRFVLAVIFIAVFIGVADIAR